MIPFINLVLGDSRDYLYQMFHYPGGEMQVRLTNVGNEMASTALEVRIYAKIRIHSDIIELVHLCNALNPYKVKKTVILPYLPYGRADRRFTVGDCYGLEVFCKLLKAANIQKVVILDPHSSLSKDTLEQEGMEVVAVSPEPFITSCIVNLAGKENKVVLLFPDKGASERYDINSSVECHNRRIDIFKIYATKKRNPVTGTFEGFDVPDTSLLDSEYPVLVVDDLCDGGGTFLGVAETLKDLNLNLNLYVTHGIFSKGTDDLLKHYKKIFTTDSFRSKQPAGVISMPCDMLILNSLR